MTAKPNVVITGLGLVCPLGIGRAAVAEAVAAKRSGIHPIREFDPTGLPSRLAGTVEDFDPLVYVKPRKTLKVLARDSQFTIAAASLAREDAKLMPDVVEPERFGVVVGAEVIRNPFGEVAEPFRACIEDDEYDFARWGTKGFSVCFPLGMLKLLPNMPACHVSIAHDARGPNNSICLREASGLSALGEALRVIERGHADVMLAGGTSARVNSFDILRYAASEQFTSCNDPARACRPFDTERDGQVIGEGAGILVLERREFAARRGATPAAALLGFGAACETVRPGTPWKGLAIRAAVQRALDDAGLSATDIGFISAHGLGTMHGDAIEAHALAEVVPNCPVYSAKGAIGNLGGACGAVETALAVLALDRRVVPPTIHCNRPDRELPIDVVHGDSRSAANPTCLVLSYTGCGQVAALVLGAA
jgi:3-oxoacyl-[acyl-carrier-protein] synthase II